MNASKAMKGTIRWYMPYVAWVLLGIAALLVKGCNNQEQDHLFIFKEAISWN